MHKLIHQIYATTLDPNQWPELVEELVKNFQLPLQNAPHIVSKVSDIEEHLSRALEINHKYQAVDEQKGLAESNLSLFPVAFFALNNQNGQFIIDPLNQKAIALLPTLKIKLLNFFKNNAKSKQQTHGVFSDHIIHNEETFLFLELPVQRIDQDSIERVVLVSLSNQFTFKDSSLFKHWKLSKKEAAICDQLLQGESINSIALLNSRSVHTIRSQVKSIFNKSNCHTQIELIRQFYSSPLAIAVMKSKDSLAYRSSLDSFSMKLKDGRTLAWSEQGDRQGVAVVICHGMHQSRLTRHPDEQFAIANKIRIITPDRPGYGKSDPFDKTPLTQWPNDLEQLMEHLQIQQFSLLGLGLGTIFAFKAAEELAEKIERITCVSLAHFVNPTTNCNFQTRAATAACRLAKYSPKLMHHVTKIMGKDIFLKNPISILTNFYPYKSQQDKETLDRKDLQQILIKDFTESNRQGFGKALLSELHFLLNHKRIFNPKKITIPVHCWRSKNNQKPSVAEIEIFCAEFPNCTIHAVENDNELIIFHEWHSYLLQTAYG